MTKSERETQERESAVKELRELLPAGSTVYTILRDVSRSGMSRNISLVALLVDPVGRPLLVHITRLVATVLGMRVKADKQGSVTVRGCGMDMGFHIVRSLAQALDYSSNDAEGSNACGLNQRWL